MSWPSDGLPRFRVVSVTGFAESVSGSCRELTMYSVLDRCYCHEIVWQESPQSRGAKRGAAYACELASRLEAEHVEQRGL